MNKYVYIGGGVVAVGIVYYIYRRNKQAQIYAQAQEAAQNESVGSYLSAPISSGYTPAVTYSAPSGVGSSSPQFSAGLSSGGGGTSFYSGSSLQTPEAASVSQKIAADLMFNVTKLNNESAYDLQRQQNQNAGVFNYAMSNMPWGGSINVDTSPSGTTLAIDNSNAWENQKFWNKVKSDVIYSDQSLKEQAATAPQKRNEDLIKSMYSAIGRETPDAAGVAYWNAQLSNGKSVDDFTKSFLGGAIVNPANDAEKEKAKKLLEGMK